MRIARVVMLVAMTLSIGGCMNYVALGDSFSSGPAIPRQIDPAGCQRSSRNYARLLSSWMRDAVLRDVSCAGATTMNMTKPQRVADGSKPPQLDALEPDTQLVTLTLGANDIGFMQVLYACASHTNIGTPCRDRYVVDGHDRIADRIRAGARKLAAVLGDIHLRAPRARVFVVGYPQLFPDVTRGCFPRVPITDRDVAYLRDEERQLNATIQYVTVASGDIYVDAFSASAGHDACQRPPLRWIEPPTAGNAAPMHPSELGMQATARLLLRSIHEHGL
jgi:lysophospholipase L1-like esterase